MTPKERVISAIKHEEPDCVPTGENQIDGKLVEQIFGKSHLYNMGWKELNALWSGRRNCIVGDYCTYLVEIPRRLGWDYVRVPVMPADKAYRAPKMTGPYSWIDGDGYEVLYNPGSGSIAVRSQYPDLHIKDLPDPDEPYVVDSSELEALKHVVKELGETHFIIARTPFGGTFPWEETVGLEEFLIRMITEPEFVIRALEVYVNRSIAYINAMLDAGADAVMTTDDYSDNTGPMMGKERFIKFMLPGLIKQCEAVHNKGKYYIKHTDGNVWEILDCFVDIGIDGWHGIQPNIGMDMKKLKQKYGKKLCFFGGVNCETLILGPPENIRQEVAYAIKNAAQGGGLVITTSNVVPPGTKLENYFALIQAVRDYGKYPVGKPDF